MPQKQPEFIPISKKEMERSGIKRPDIILVSADAYVDHPSFAAAILGRTLISAGFSAVIISQPDWKDKSAQDFKEFGEPGLFFAIVPGAVDPMINAFTPALKRRHNDVYSPDGIPTRPDRVTAVYTNILHKLYPNAPIIIGGVEASLRRFAHYDYWSDKVRQSILSDVPATLLVYGCGELALIEIASRLKSGEKISDLTDIRGTCFRMSLSDFRSGKVSGTLLPSYPDAADKKLFAESFKIISTSDDILIQPHPKTVIVCNPPMRPMTKEELDRVYDAPFTRRQHPAIKGKVPALEPVQFSITTHRGCFGSCSFCSITHHQGKIVVSRSQESILREAERISKMKEFRGTISDVGGPSANMYGCRCKKWDENKACINKSCINCPSLKNGTEAQIELLEKIRNIKGIKHVFVSSGIRYDLIPENEIGKKYIQNLSRYYISGHLKAAPEHISDHVTKLMNKPGKAEFEKFKKYFDSLQKDKAKKQYIVPYLMSSHPGCRISDMIELALYLRENNLYTEQVQDFTPSPMTMSTAMYYSGINPMTLDAVYCAKGSEKKIQRAMLQWKDRRQYEYIIQGLKKAGRKDLIGDLVPYRR
ncbi:MAG TPA: YgiQ family radical SAM protein [Methanocorpusculum sp.]|nr:YgiQ family radical SAM protein [Methanocorpusculum sp.]